MFFIYILFVATLALVALLILSVFFGPVVTPFDIVWNLVLASAFLVAGVAFLQRKRWAPNVAYAAVLMFHAPSLLSVFQGLGWQSTGYLPNAFVLVILLCVVFMPERVLEESRRHPEQQSESQAPPAPGSETVG